MSDQGLPQHSVIVPVSIYLQDINDKIPSFKKHYTFTVNLPVFRGTVIGRVEAFDEDTVPNVPLQYSLLYTSSVLDINQFTGKKKCGLTTFFCNIIGDLQLEKI